MIAFKEREFIIDGQKKLILAGEIHYFRLPIKEWEKRISDLKDCGCNTVATYVPWLCHEEIEGDFDFTGIYNESLNLTYFIELCAKHQMLVILRPGPFVMAELKNEGIPYWIYQKHQHIIPKSWDQTKVTTSTVDYLLEGFLKDVKNWFFHLYQVIKKDLHQYGGPIIAIQLDNEVGMLSWVSNQPDLTPKVIDSLKTAYNYSDDFDFYAPQEITSLKYHNDLSYHMRKRFKDYIDELKSYWVQFGVIDIIYFINIHGSSNGRSLTFPIGISQLFLTYQEKLTTAGIDIYMNSIDISNFHDLYLAIIFSFATLKKDHPLGTLEFNSSDGNFGDNLGSRALLSDNDFKIRMSLALGQRMLNYYLFCGGYNYRLRSVKGFGNDRIAFTGERHGFAAPISASGKKNYFYNKLKETTTMFKTMESFITRMQKVTDDFKIGLILDYYMSEYSYPKSTLRKQQLENITFHRTHGIADTIVKHLLLLNYSFDAIHLEEDNLDPNTTKLLVLGSAAYLSKNIQEKLVNYHQNGGKLFLIGDLPVYDLKGNPCTILIDYLNIAVIKSYHEYDTKELSVYLDDFLDENTEHRSNFATTIKTDEKAFIKHFPTNQTVAYYNDTTVFIATSIPGNLEILSKLMAILKIKPLISYSNKEMYLQSTLNKVDDGYFLSILNLDHLDYKTTITLNNEPLFCGKEIDIFAQNGMFLPINIILPVATIVYSTAEIFKYSNSLIIFRLTQHSDTIKLQTNKKIASNSNLKITYQDDFLVITVMVSAKVKEFLEIEFI